MKTLDCLAVAYALFGGTLYLTERLLGVVSWCARMVREAREEREQM